MRPLKGIVWYNTNRERAEQILEDIIKKYGFIEEKISKRVKSKNSNFVEFENGDRWQIANAKENMKGAACNISYIASNIEKEIIDIVIKPCTKSYPFQAFNYYYAD